MRLRLTVQRNGLPAANILWSVPDTNSTQAYTITRLLEDVNHIIPLEAEHWGLEHYVVEVGGFECLHFMPVINALKEDDHVSIRPLMTAEIRARTLTGRDQISDGGQHLVDGIPFGRPYLRQPNRPPVRIPPRKRRRLDDGEAEPEPEPEPETTALLMEHGEETEEEEEPLPLLNGHTVSRSGVNKSGRESKTVHFQEPEIDESDDSEEDDDFVPGDGDESASSAEDSEDDSDSDSGSAAKPGSSSSASDTSDSGSDSDTTSNSDSGSDSDDSDASAPPDVLSSKDGRKTTATKHVPPGQGLKATKVRNSRRTRVNRLRRLITSGLLPEGAGLSDLKNYEEGNFGQPREEENSTSAQPFSRSQGKRKRLDEEEGSAGMGDEDALQLEKRKKELMARLGDTLSSPVPSVDFVQPQTIPVDEAPAEKVAASRRLRPDTAAIGRILARQAAPVARKGGNKAAVDEVAELEGASDPDFWKSRINVSAFECWDEEFELSAPPFPFEQHWDPASKAMREKAAKKKQKKKQSHAPQQKYAVQEEDEEENIILDYDDAPAANNESEIIDAAIEDQLQQDLATAAQIDLAALPEDMSTLPDLTAADMKKGAVIACKFFTVNPITVTPEISGFKTATVEHEGDSGPGAGTIQLRIAARDLVKKEKKFDGKGNRVYNAADALLMESDDEEDGLWEGQFGELLEAKLVKAA